MSNDPFSSQTGGIVGPGGSVSAGEAAQTTDPVTEQKLRGPPSERTPARVGTVDFKFDDPAVEVTSEANVVEQETINDTVVVQQLGTRADQITITGVVTEAQAKKLDRAPEQSLVNIRTQRWTGDVHVESVSTAYRREVDREQNALYDVTIEALEVNRTDRI